MIAPYEFDSANGSGDKEAVIVPNVPTLVNKLSAHETNGIRDKLNEVVGIANTILPIQFLELRLKFKGEGNTLDTLQAGDIVHGFADATTIWTNAKYLGGDIADRANYEEIKGVSPVPEILDGIIGVTIGFAVSQQTFTLPAGAKCVGVTLSHAPQYQITPNNSSLVNRWSQTDNIVTLTKVPALNNYIYIEYVQ